MTDENDSIPSEKRAELNHTETGRQAVRVIDALSKANVEYVTLLKEAADLLNHCKPHIYRSEGLDRYLNARRMGFR